ncbi:AAA domain-containing protein [Curtobacterium sp. SGAir0471]|uniref:AAA domain-containing protein n=2 Tax=unclassified Curtobacterium TaxID=257496 RepID=UPI0010F9C5D4|nr:AAA domain-containing protein [Curtobacterium sp. SGAir0471]
MRDHGDFTTEQSVLDQSYDLLEYLSAVAREIGPKPVRDVRRYATCILPSAVPEHQAVILGPSDSRTAWLSIDRVPAPAPLEVPPPLEGLVVPEAALLSASGKPALDEERAAQRVEEQLTRRLGEPPEEPDLETREVRAALRDGLSQALRVEFDVWSAELWSPWAQANRPSFAARELYSALYDLHLEAEASSATHEVVWGHVVMSARDGETEIIAPMLTTPVSVQLGPEDSVIRVIPEQAVELELDSVEGTDLNGRDGLVKLRSVLRETPPDPWDSQERLAVRQQIAAPLGVDATLTESADFAEMGAGPVINDGWVLFIRKRPLRQERFYDELAQKIRSEQFLPEGLASVVADRDRVDDALLRQGHELTANDGTADRLLMPLPANAEQERIATQLATSRGVTVQGPPGTGKSHTIVNLVSHLVAQGKRVLVTAEKEQALSVLREKIPVELRDLSLAVLGSTPAALEDLRTAAQSMQDSLSALDVPREERRIADIAARVDELRDSVARTDASLVRALQSEQREYELPEGPSKAPQVAAWLARDRELDVISDRIPVHTAFPVTVEEFSELIELVRGISEDDSRAAVLNLPDAHWLPSGAELRAKFDRLEDLRARVTTLEDQGLRLDRVDGLTVEIVDREVADLRRAAATVRELSGDWENPFAAAVRGGDQRHIWVAGHQPGVKQKIGEARDLSMRMAGHVVAVPDGDPTVQFSMVHAWAERLAAGKKLSMFAAKELRDFATQTTVDSFPVTTSAQLDLVGVQIALRVALREAHVRMTQAYAAVGIPVPPLDGSFLFTADHLAARVDTVGRWWSEAYPLLAERVEHFIGHVPSAVGTSEFFTSAAEVLQRAGARLEERILTAELEALESRIRSERAAEDASPLWYILLDALELAAPDKWDEAVEETRRLIEVRARVLRAEELAERIEGAGAKAWVRSIRETRAESAVVGNAELAPLAWERARARTWLSSLHAETDTESLMTRSHADAIELRRAIVDLASRSARVELKKNFQDRKRRALETWLSAVKRVGKGTGKNAPRFQAAAREALPAAMGAVPIWIMPIYRVMENFDPRVSDLFDVVVVDESSQCDLLSLGVLALGKKTVVVGDDRQTTPERVGNPTERIAALQDQHLKSIPEAKLLTLDDSLYSISGRAFPSTIALREHFRCVPEIIEFSNRYYNGAILPLKEVRVPQIGDPLKVVHVEDAISVQRGSSRVNTDEAKAIAAQVAQCAEDPSYEGLTFGVVTMMSGPQAQILQDMIREAIGDEEFERRRVRVGNPPLFQGDERNVMFVSMVAHDASFAATTLRYAQWANVAASRAQDQLWIFHSMDASTLHHEDHRRAMIEYAQSYLRRDQTSGLYELTESKFERDVLKQMLDRGHDVQPQHRVGSYRLDFVVRVAPGERLAVECDGDSFHGPDKWDDDVRRQRVLERMGWSFWRIRASKYYLDPEEAMKPLWARLEMMKERAAEAADLVRVREVHAETERLERLRAHDAPAAEASDDSAERLSIQEGSSSNTALEEAAVASEQPTTDHLEPPAARSTGEEAVPQKALVTDVDAALSTAVIPSSGGQRSSERAARFAPLLPAPVPALRRWARANGFAVGERGRISAEIVSAWRRAHADDVVDRTGPHDESSIASERDWTPAEVSPVHGSEPGAGTRARAAWETGAAYQLDTEGNILPLYSRRTLASYIGEASTCALREVMRSVRPNGGRFKVDEAGTMATLVDGEPVYVCTVQPDAWFPAHWSNASS